MMDTLFASNGSPARTRTADPMVNSHLLCQLSYWGSIEAENVPMKHIKVKRNFSATLHIIISMIKQITICDNW